MPEAITPKFREATYGRDLRIDYPEKAALEEVCQQAIRHRRGHVLLLAGPRLSGRSDLLQTLGQHIKENIQGVNLCTSKFSPKGESEDVAIDYNARIELVTKGLGIAGEVLPDSAARLIKKANALLKGYLEGKKALGAKDAAAALWQSIDELKQRLLDETLDKPLVWLIDDFDKCAADFSHALLYEFLPQLSSGLAVIFVLTVEGKAKLEEDPDKTDRLQSLAHALIANKVGQWHAVRPLSKNEISTWLGNTPPGLVETLWQTTEGYPPRVVETWYRWQKENYVSYSDNEETWKLNPQNRPSLNPARNLTDTYLRDRFPDSSPEQRDEVRQMLHLCALEGETFTADCIAETLDQDVDEYQDFLDDHFARDQKNPDGLFHEPESYSFRDKFGEERQVWRYRFVSTLDWLALSNERDARLYQKRTELARVLCDLYDEADPKVANTLARIYEANEDIDQARHYRKTVDYSLQIDQMAIRAYHVINLVKRTDLEPDPYTRQQFYDLLIDAGIRMLDTYPHRETFRVFYVATRVARHLTDPTVLLHAQYCCSISLLRMSRYKKAGSVLAQLRSKIEFILFSKEGRGKIGARVQLKYLLASCLLSLGHIALEQGDYEKAAVLFEQALEIAREIHNRNPEASCLIGLGDIARMQGEYEKAVPLYEQALEIAREINDRDREASCSWRLGEIAQMQDEYEKAVPLYEQALEIAREINDRSQEASCLNGLGDIARMQGEYEKAVPLYEQALEIAREINDREHEASCLFCLRDIARKQGDYEKAASLCEQELEIAREINNRGMESSCLDDLVSIAQLQGDYEKAALICEQALEIAHEINDRRWEASCLLGLRDIAQMQDEYEKAASLCEQELGIAREINDRRLEASCLSGLGDIAQMQDEYERAASLYEQALEIAREINDSSLETVCLAHLGAIASGCILSIRVDRIENI